MTATADVDKSKLLDLGPLTATEGMQTYVIPAAMAGIGDGRVSQRRDLGHRDGTRDRRRVAQVDDRPMEFLDDLGRAFFNALYELRVPVAIGAAVAVVLVAVRRPAPRLVRGGSPASRPEPERSSPSPSRSAFR